MTIYLFTILVLSVFAMVEVNISDYNRKQTVNHALIPITFLIIWCQFAMRWRMATDWDNYYNFFNYNANWEDLDSGIAIFEKGYWIFCILVKSIVDDYTFFLFVLEACIAFMLFRFFRFSTPYAILAILLYYSLYIGYLGANRQLFAIALCLVGLKNLINGNRLVFFGYVLLAFYFHTSAVLFLIYFFTNIKVPTLIVILTIIACVIIGNTSIPFNLFASVSGLSDYNAGKVQAYLKGASLEDSTATISTLGIVKRMIITTAFVLNRNKIKAKYKYYDYLLNGYLFGVAFYFLFAKSLAVMVSRGSMYFNVMEPVLLSLQLTIINNKNVRNVIAILLCGISVVFFFQSIKTYPHAFIPYRSFFNK